MSRSNFFTFATVVTAGNFTIVYLLNVLTNLLRINWEWDRGSRTHSLFPFEAINFLFFFFCHCSTFWLITTGNGYCKRNKVKLKCHSVNTKFVKFFFIDSHPLNTPFRNSDGCQTKINKAQITTVEKKNNTLATEISFLFILSTQTNNKVKRHSKKWTVEYSGKKPTNFKLFCHWANDATRKLVELIN